MFSDIVISTPATETWASISFALGVIFVGWFVYNLIAYDSDNPDKGYVKSVIGLLLLTTYLVISMATLLGVITNG